MNNVILSGENPQFGQRLSQLGYNVIYSEYLHGLIPYERRHADMQCLIIGQTAFVLKDCHAIAERLESSYHVVFTEKDINGKYPNNVLLNAAVVGKYLIANTKYLDKSVKEYCLNEGYQLIHVNQGYAKCSCAVVSDHALITADRGIYNSLKEYNIEVLLIRQGRVQLKGADYGFIGGASGLDIRHGERILYFSGNICAHPDYDMISEFCGKHQTRIYPLTDTELYDIGGMIFC